MGGELGLVGGRPARVRVSWATGGRWAGSPRNWSCGGSCGLVPAPVLPPRPAWGWSASKSPLQDPPLRPLGQKREGGLTVVFRKGCDVAMISFFEKDGNEIYNIQIALDGWLIGWKCHSFLASLKILIISYYTHIDQNHLGDEYSFCYY